MNITNRIVDYIAVDRRVIQLLHFVEETLLRSRFKKMETVVNC